MGPRTRGANLDQMWPKYWGETRLWPQGQKPKDLQRFCTCGNGPKTPNLWSCADANPEKWWVKGGHLFRTIGGKGQGLTTSWG